MADFYDEMADFSQEILSPTSEGGLGQTGIELIVTKTTPNPAGSWLEPITQESKEVLRGVSSTANGYEDGVTILATDGRVVASPPSIPFRMSPDHTMTVELDGKPHKVIAVNAKPPTGRTVVVEFFIRG